MENQKYLIALIAILLLAACIRLYKITEIPTGFFTDEAAIGVNAYTILHNGTDQFGVRYPALFRAFGEYRGGLPIYTAVPFILLFGFGEFAVRFNSVFFGLLSIIFVYLLVTELFRNHPNRKVIGLLSALFLAISPWHIHYSRTGWDGWMQFVSLTILALYLFLKAQQNPKLLPVSIGLFGLTLYAYMASRVFIPLLGLTLFCLYFKYFKANRKWALISLFVLLFVLAPFVLQHLKPETWGKWKASSIFSNQTPNHNPKLVHIMITYFSHFSTDFLFTRGHIDMPGSGNRHSVRGMGELYLIQLPFIIIGLYALWSYRPKTTFGILLAWLLLYPVAASLTTEQAGTTTRSIIGVVPFQIITAFGIVTFFIFYKEKLNRFSHRTKKILFYLLIGILILLIILSFSYYLKLFFVDYPKYSSDYWGWQYGSKDIVTYFMSVENKYDNLYMSTEFNGAEELISFYSANGDLGCKKCTVAGLDHYSPEKRQLFAVSPAKLAESKYNSSFEIQKVISYPYTQEGGRQVAFLVGEVKT